MDVKLTKDADALVCLMYKRFLELRDNGISREEAKFFGGYLAVRDAVMPTANPDDVADYCRELDTAELLRVCYGDGKPSFIWFQDDAIVYMEGRFKSGLSDVLDYLSKIRTVLLG